MDSPKEETSLEGKMHKSKLINCFKYVLGPLYTDELTFLIEIMKPDEEGNVTLEGFVQLFSLSRWPPESVPVVREMLARIPNLFRKLLDWNTVFGYLGTNMSEQDVVNIMDQMQKGLAGFFEHLVANARDRTQNQDIEDTDTKDSFLNPKGEIMERYQEACSLLRPDSDGKVHSSKVIQLFESSLGPLYSAELGACLIDLMEPDEEGNITLEGFARAFSPSHWPAESLAAMGELLSRIPNQLCMLVDWDGIFSRLGVNMSGQDVFNMMEQAKKGLRDFLEKELTETTATSGVKDMTDPKAAFLFGYRIPSLLRTDDYGKVPKSKVKQISESILGPLYSEEMVDYLIEIMQPDEEGNIDQEGFLQVFSLSHWPPESVVAMREVLAGIPNLVSKFAKWDNIFGLLGVNKSEQNAVVYIIKWAHKSAVDYVDQELAKSRDRISNQEEVSKKSSEILNAIKEKMHLLQIGKKTSVSAKVMSTGESNNGSAQRTE